MANSVLSSSLSLFSISECRCAPRVQFRSCGPRQKRIPARQRLPLLKAASGKGEADPVVEFANSIGLPTDEGLFGFKPFAEVWVGRLAMVGFITSIIEEAITGNGTLGQIGLITPNPALCGIIFGGSVTATLGAILATITSARSGDIPKRQLDRYRAFLGMKDEAKDIQETQRAMKMAGDFTSPDNLKAIAQAKAEGTPADAILSSVSPSDAPATVQDAGPAKAEPQPDVGAGMGYISDDFAYAREVELSNGRWAMIGFLSAIIVEAATGKGIIMQLIGYFKLVGLLGDASGF